MPVVATRDEQHPERDRKLLDGMQPGRPAGAEGRGAVVGADRVEGVTAARKGTSADSKLLCSAATSHTASIADRVPSLASDRQVSTTVAGVAPGAQAAATAAAKTPAASLP